MPNNTVVLSRPIKSGCNFNAVGNPVVYKLRREDYQFNQINDNGGFAQIQINGTDLTTYFVVSDTVFIEGLGAATITAVSFGTDTLITVDIAFDATSSGYINNNSNRTDYKIEVEVFDFATNESLGPRIVGDPDEAGELKVNVSGEVSAYVSPNWSLPTVNEVDSEVSKKVYIKYQEFFDVTYWDLVTDAANPIICVFAYIPLLLGSPPDFTRYAHGGNLLSYYPETDERKFLTRFLKPKTWRGWPFSLSFIWPEITDINRRVKQYNSEGTELSDSVTVLDDPTDSVHRMTLGDIDDNAKELIVNLEDGSVSGEVVITEELTVNVVDPCESQLLLFWKNCLGGDSFWMFDESQDYQFAYPSGRRVKRMTLFSDNLKVDEWDAINELNSPTDVIASNIVDYEMSNTVDKTHFRNDNQVFIINQDGEKVGVIVIPTDNKTKTIYKKHSIEITIELPEFFTL